MTDIIERLRGIERDTTPTLETDLMTEAANEIERLKAELEMEQRLSFRKQVAQLEADVEELKNKLQLMKDEALLFKVNVELARDLKKAIAERDAAVKALRQYGHHLSMCKSNILLTSMPPQRQPCDCGLNAAIDAARGEV